MASGFGFVGSVLTERPPSEGPRTPRTTPATPPPSGPATGPQPLIQSLLAEPAARPAPPRPATPPPAPVAPLGPGPASGHPHAPQAAPPSRPAPGGPPANGAAAAQSAGNRAWYDSLLSGRQYDVVYDDSDGYPLLAFADGQWFDVTSFRPQPVTVRYAMRLDPAWAGAIVQTVCMWMRSNPNHDRSFELATELALAVGELARLASS